MFRPLQVDELEPGMVALLGVPWDEKSSHVKGAAQAPGAIRGMMHSGVSNWVTESLHNLWFNEDRFVDVGDLTLTTGNTVMDEITAGLSNVLEKNVKVISVGGDHAVAYPLIRAAAKKYDGLNVLQIDAHPDLYDECDGDPYSHGCPFARAMEDGLIKRLVQVGIRANTPHQQEQAERFGVEMIDMRAWRPDMAFEFEGPLYISLDLDGVDPGMAPGVAHPEPGGLTSREVISIIQRFRGDLVAADLVELIPSRDVSEVTTMLAVKLIKEMVGRMLEV